MKLSIFGLAVLSVAFSGTAAMADTTTTVTHQESVGLDLNAAGGADMAGSGGERQTSKSVVIETNDLKHVKVLHRRPHRAVFNNQAELALPKII